MKRIKLIATQSISFNAEECNKTKKVYREKYMHFPSGQHLCFYVWSEKMGCCTWIKENDCTVID